MIIDSSALLAVVFHEPEAERFTEAIAASPRRWMAAVNWLESLMVTEARGGASAVQNLLLTLADLEIELVTMDRIQLAEAHAAWQRFGKGRHRAGLNLGDCCAYAAAASLREPLLFKGNDFARTDIESASPGS